MNNPYQDGAIIFYNNEADRYDGAFFHFVEQNWEQYK